MTEEKEPTPAPSEPAAPPSNAPGWIEGLHAKQASMGTVQLLLMVVLLGLVLWLAFDKGMGAILEVAGLILIVVALLLNSFLVPVVFADMTALDLTRVRVLFVGGMVGLVVALYGAAKGIAWWSDVMSWLDESGPGKPWRALLAVIIIIAGLGIMFSSLQLARTEERKNAFLRRLLYGYNAVLSGLLLLAILSVVNVLVVAKFKSPDDFTSAGIYTLSDSGRNILRGISQPVELTYLAMEPFKNQEVQTLLSNCRDVTDKVQPREISLRFNIQEAQELNDKYPGLQPGCLLVVVKSGEEKEDYRVIEDKDLFTMPGGFGGGGGDLKFSGEAALMTALRELGEGKKPAIIYFTQDHGELDLDDPGQERGKGASVFKRELERRKYTVKPLKFNLLEPKVPEDASVVVVAGAHRPFSAAELKALRDYLGKGGKFFILLDGTVVDKKMSDTGLEMLLVEAGIQTPHERILSLRIKYDVTPVEVVAIMDPRLAQNPLAQAFQRRGFLFEDTRPLELMESKGMGKFSAEPLMLVLSMSFPESNLSTPPSEIIGALVKNKDALQEKAKAMEERGPAGMAKSPLKVAAIVYEMNFNPSDPHAMMRGPSERKPRMLVFGTSSIATNKALQEQEAYVNLLTSCIDFLREKPQLIDIAAKTRNTYSSPPKSDVEKVRIIFMPALLALCGVLGLATGVWVVRRR